MNNIALNALLIDDDPDFIADFRILLPEHITCLTAQSVAEADRCLQDHDVDVVFLDIDLGAGGDGLAYLTRLKTDNPYLPVIMITADQKVASVVKAMQSGASDYVSKSPDLNVLKMAVNRSIEAGHLRRRYDLLESELKGLIGRMVGESDVIRQIKAEMMRLASVTSNVLITGQSGTGKELVARGIHRLSPNREEPFIAVNCPALSRELIESELFGHERGAFTGAAARRIGKFEQAGQGTIFLDEITEIPPEVQAKLLRVLQEREFERVGGNRLIPLKARVLASTNRNIDEALASGEIREDLLYRLDVTRIHLPPLSERCDDIPLLVDYFLGVKAADMKKPVPRISPEAMRLMCAYDWPSNVRGLSNCIENAIVHSDRDILEPADFERCGVIGDLSFGSYEDAKAHFLSNFQRTFITGMLRKNKGNFTNTARDMGVTRQGLMKMMKSCGLTSDNTPGDDPDSDG